MSESSTSDSATPAPAPAPASTSTPFTSISESDPTILTHIQTYHNTRCCASPIYSFLFGPPSASLLTFTSASRGIFTARLTLHEQHLNSAGGIHGSVSATIVDWAGGLAIAAWDLSRHNTGVSVDINISYLSSARLGEEIEIEGRVERVGANLGFTEVRIWKVGGEGKRGGLVASGRHTKFVKVR